MSVSGTVRYGSMVVKEVVYGGDGVQVLLAHCRGTVTASCVESTPSTLPNAQGPIFSSDPGCITLSLLLHLLHLTFP